VLIWAFYLSSFQVEKAIDLFQALIRRQECIPALSGVAVGLMIPSILLLDLEMVKWQFGVIGVQLVR